jgi:nucleotide-binding universal stress UspA family protein
MATKIIVVPTDFSENAQAAFKIACELASQLGAKIYLLHVRDESALRIAIREGLLSQASTDKELQKAVEQLTEKRFDQMLDGIDTTSIEIERVSRHGDSDAVIPAFAKQVHADLIVIGRHGAGMIEKIRSAVLGSVAESVISKSPCPVLVVRREHNAKK